MPKQYLTDKEHDRFVNKLNSYDKIPKKKFHKREQTLERITVNLTNTYKKYTTSRPQRLASNFINSRLEQLKQGKSLRTKIFDGRLVKNYNKHDRDGFIAELSKKMGLEQSGIYRKMRDTSKTNKHAKNKKKNK